MAPSTEQIDQLLEWQPGPSDAGTTNVLAALAWGARRASQSKLLIVYLWLFYVLLVDGAGTAILGALSSSATLGDAVQEVIRHASVGTIFGSSRGLAGATYRAVVFESTARQMWVPTAYFIGLYGLLAGGVIAYLHAPRPAPLLAQLGATCGTYWGRFTRLLVIAAAVSWVLRNAADALFAGSATGTSVWLQVIAFVMTMWLLAGILDYARVRAVARDSRSMVLESARSARFFLRNLPRTLALEVLFILLAALSALVALALARGLEWVFSTRTTILIAEQALVLALLWVRVTAWGAMLALYQGIAQDRLAQR
jgi:hypothetical protein